MYSNNFLRHKLLSYVLKCTEQKFLYIAVCTLVRSVRNLSVFVHTRSNNGLYHVSKYLLIKRFLNIFNKYSRCSSLIIRPSDRIGKVWQCIKMMFQYFWRLQFERRLIATSLWNSRNLHINKFWWRLSPNLKQRFTFP